MAHHLSVKGIAPLSRTPGFRVEGHGDFGAVVACQMQFCRARDQSAICAERLCTRHWADECLLRSIASMPVAFQVHLLTAVDHVYQNTFKQQPHDGLTIGLGSCFSSPYHRHILCQAPDHRHFGDAWRLTPLTSESVVLCFELGLLG